MRGETIFAIVLRVGVQELETRFSFVVDHLQPIQIGVDLLPSLTVDVEGSLDFSMIYLELQGDEKNLQCSFQVVVDEMLDHLFTHVDVLTLIPRTPSTLDDLHESTIHGLRAEINLDVFRLLVFEFDLVIYFYLLLLRPTLLTGLLFFFILFLLNIISQGVTTSLTFFSQ